MVTLMALAILRDLVAKHTRHGRTRAAAEMNPLHITIFRRSFALALCLVLLAPETGHAAASAYINGTLPGFGSSFLWPNPPLTVTDQDSALTLAATSNGNIAVIDTDPNNSFDIRIFMPAQTLLPGTYAGASRLGGETISGVLPKIASLDMTGHDAGLPSNSVFRARSSRPGSTRMRRASIQTPLNCLSSTLAATTRSEQSRS